MGDYGFDPLRLATNPDRMKWFRAAELYNGQWAMLGVVGCLASDLLGLQKWWLAGAEVSDTHAFQPSCHAHVSHDMQV